MATWWNALYTRGLPAPARDRRREEVAADVADHIGAGGRGRDVAGRVLRGVGADLSWRRATAVRAGALRQSVAVPIALVVGPVVFGVAFQLFNMGGQSGLSGEILALTAPVAVAAGLVALLVSRLAGAPRRRALRRVASCCAALLALSVLAVNLGPTEGPEWAWFAFVALGIFTTVPVGLAALIASLLVRGDR